MLKFQWLHIRNEHDVFYAAFLIDMSCVPKFFSGTVELPDASVLLDLLPQTPGKS